MATLKHDAQGFLVGDAIDLERSRSLASMRNDVRAIRAGVAGIASLLAHAQTVPRVRPRAPVVSQLVPDADLGRTPVSVQPELRRPAVPTKPEADAARTTTHRAVAQPRNRDSRGRFIGNAGRPKAQPPQRSRTAPGAGAGDGQDEDDGRLHDFAERLVGAIKESSVGMEQADPAIKALREVAQPMARGYELLSGGDKQKRQEGWLRRIYASLTGFRKDESAFSKAAAKRLKSLDEKPAAKTGGDSGWLGTLGAMLKRIPGVGTLTAGAGKFLSGGGGLLAGVARGVLGFGRGMLRRLPFIGSLLSGIGAASEIYDTETDDAMSRREKDKHDGAAVGGFAGTVGGMFAGAKVGALLGSFAGPIGTAIGGAVGGAAGMFFGDQAGQIIGDKVGEWVTDLREADIPGKITAAWDATTETLRKAWDSALARLSEGWQSVKKAGQKAGNWVATQGDAANDFIKDKTGVDIKGSAVRALSSTSKMASSAKSAVVDAGAVVADKAAALKNKAVDLGGRAVDAVKGGAQWAATNTTVGRGAAKAWEGAKAARNWVLGQTSRIFESGKGGAGTVSSGKGDHGGASYGTYQLSSTQGTLQQFLASSKYGKQFSGLKPGTPEFDAKWKEVAKSDSSFGGAQHDFIKTTHYDPAVSGLKGAGIDLSGRGAAVQDAIWSSSVQFGAGSSRRRNGAVGIFQKALAGRDVAGMSDKDIVAAVQDYKLANNGRLFSTSSAAVRKGTAKRAEAEKKMLLTLAGKSAAEPAAPAPRNPAAPAPQTVAHAPDVTAHERACAEVSPTAVSLGPTPAVPAGVATPAAPVVASARMPMAPAGPAVPAVAEAPRIDVPLASNDSRKPVVIASSPSEVGQDLRERGIAHIVTGGLGA